jgi:predicted HTH transcriptional regulator
MPFTLTFHDVSVVADTADEARALLLCMNGGGTKSARRRRMNGAAHAGAAHAADNSPGSLEARIVAHVRSRGEVAPGELASAMNVDRATSRRVVSALVKAGKLKARGTTMSRRITLAK